MFPAVLLLFVTRVLLGMEKSNQVNVMGEMALFCRSDELKYQLLNIDLLEDMRHGYAKPLKNLLQTSNDELVILSYRMCCEYNLTQTLFTKKSKEILLDQDDFHNLV